MKDGEIVSWEFMKANPDLLVVPMSEIVPLRAPSVLPLRRAGNVCGHPGGISQGAVDGIAIIKCRDCGHTWKEIANV